MHQHLCPGGAVFWSGIFVVAVGNAVAAGHEDERGGADRAEAQRVMPGIGGEAHDLRMRTAGQASFLEFHLVVPGTMTVAAAHVICDRIEAALQEETPGVVITIHVEPEAKAKHAGVLVP